jgi:membrane protease YdiL (CAAX protease family)
MYEDVGGSGVSFRVVEFVALYMALPAVIAFGVPTDWLLPALIAVTLLALGLLAATPGFSWRELGRGWRGVDAGHVALAALATAAVAGAMVWWLVPYRAFSLPRHATGLWLAILVLYPILSALPQELMFRVLFFRRYAALFPNQRAALLANGALFGFAHLMVWNWVAVGLSALGGLIFAEAYLRRGGLPAAVVLHAVCGAIIFTIGLGTYFYHGAVAIR